MAATVLQVADIHLRGDGREIYGRDPERALVDVLQACERELAGVDLVLLSGDQSDDGEPAALARVKELIDPLDAHVLAIPGNHDGPDVQRGTFGDWRPVELDGWRVVGVDSSVAGEIHGAVDVAAVEARLDALDERPTLLAIHHPPVPPTAHPWFQLEHAAGLLESLAGRPHVRAVLSGHVHHPFERVRGQLRLLGAPSTLVPFSFRGAELSVGGDGPLGARVLSLERDGSLGTRLIEV